MYTANNVTRVKLPSFVISTGYIGSGKSVAAAFLRNFGYNVYSTGTFVKEELLDITTSRPEKAQDVMNYSRNVRSYLEVVNHRDVKSSRDLAVLRQIVYSKPTAGYVRFALEDLSNYRREQHPTYWVERLCNKIEKQHDPIKKALIHVEGARYLDEVEYIGKRLRLRPLLLNVRSGKNDNALDVMSNQGITLLLNSLPHINVDNMAKDPHKLASELHRVLHSQLVPAGTNTVTGYLPVAGICSTC